MHARECICRVTTTNQFAFILKIDVFMDSGDLPDIGMRRTINRFTKVFSQSNFMSLLSYMSKSLGKKRLGDPFFKGEKYCYFSSGLQRKRL